MDILAMPIWLVGIAVVGGATVIGVTLVYAMRPFVRPRRGEEHNSVLSDGFGLVGTMYAIVGRTARLRPVLDVRGGESPVRHRSLDAGADVPVRAALSGTCAGAGRAGDRALHPLGPR